MCQIIVKEVEIIDDAVNFLIKNKSEILELLKLKGGEGYSFFAITKDKTIEIKNNINMEINFEVFIKNLNDYALYLKLNNKNDNCKIVLFSRQKPEMERDFNIDLLPPFKKRVENKNIYYWVHGTISNDQELIKKYNLKDIKVDTQVVELVNPNELKGLFSEVRIISESSRNVLEVIDGGLGWWENKENNFYMVQPFDTITLKTIKNVQPYQVNKKNKEHNLFIAYSGGMDITLSTIKAIENLLAKNNLNILNTESPLKFNVYLYYFKYGSRAENEEIQVLYKFQEFLKKYLAKKDHYYYEFNIEAKEIDISEIMSGLINLYGNCKLTDKNAKGDIKETEENIQYVPYRNSTFVNILSTEIDKLIDQDYSKKNSNYYIVFGLNLSEGQVFGDNSIRWKSSIEEIAKIGGKYYKNVKVLAPYVHKTKINMISDFRDVFGKELLMELLNISFSCYYPKENGEPCEECGSCILRKQALKKLYIKE